MKNTIPLISSGVSGPLGILHLPRLWQKVSLDVVGKLDGEYPAIGGGYDQMLLDAFGISNESLLAFMQSKPTYPQLENWVLEQKGGSISNEELESFNASVIGFNHSDDVRKVILEANGIADDETILDAVSLNNLDDWLGFHSQQIS